MVSASGAHAASEPLSSRGRADLVIIFQDKAFVIEFKCNQSADAAIDQILDKGYADKYRQSGKEIFLLGINFSTEKRNVSEWRLETYNPQAT